MSLLPLPDLLCVICLRGPHKEVQAVTICEGQAVCLEHVYDIRLSDDALRALTRARKAAP